MTDAYCALHAAECAARKPAAVNATCWAGSENCTVDGMEDGKGMVKGLQRVDMSGVGMVLMIALLLLIGVHFGWDSEKKPGSPGAYCVPCRGHAAYNANDRHRKGRGSKKVS